jgi:arylsulfatase A-like enzyme
MKRIVLFAVIGFFIFSAKAEEIKKDTRPNIIFLLADDLIYDGLGCMGRTDMKTPNLDKIGEAGAIFTKAYNTTAICMASRASIMTGLYEFSTGCNFDHGDMEYDIWKNSYPNILHQNGYHTGFAGKFGFRVKKPDGSKGNVETVKKSFDWWCGWLGQGNYQMEENKDAEEYIKLNGNQPEHTTYALGEMGSEFIKKYAGNDKPFCLSISFKAPHTPYATDTRYDTIFDKHTFNKPGNFGNDKNLPKQAVSGRPFQKGKTWMKDYHGTMEKYHTMVYGMDVAVGMLVKELEKQGVAQNTVIIFTSDNGHFNGSKALGGKLYAYEEGSKAPLIYYDPRLPKEKRTQKNDALTAVFDIAPTILELAGIDIPKGLHGKSIVPLVEQKVEKNHKSLLLMNVWGIASAQSLAVVTPTTKYINWFYGSDGFDSMEELFNLIDDPLEMNNLYEKEKHQTELKYMQSYYDEWMKFWEKEGVDRNGYPKYLKLANRTIPFDSHPKEMVDDMYFDKKADKNKTKLKKKN